MTQVPERSATNALSAITFDGALSVGARNAIRTCLRLQPDERISIVTDERSKEIAASLASEVMEVGSEMSVSVLEDHARRPLTDMPQAILDDLARSQVSIYAAMPQQGELRSRMQMTELVNKRRIRHGHMVHITKRIMCEGMRADFMKVDALGSAIIARARTARTITATSPAGTKIVADFLPSIRWVKTSGIISNDTWGNLPGGEIFTCPGNINGVFVVDGVVGDYLCQRYGDLQQTPLKIEIKDSRIVTLACENSSLLDDFRKYTHTDENSDRIGEFAIGTNLAVHDIIGEILQDEKIPGVHIAFGHPYAEQTGATWTSTTHIDCVGRRFDIEFDGELIMRDGKFLDSYVPKGGQ